MNKTLCLGGVGYLGCQISRLLAKTNQVTIVDNFLHNQQSQVVGLLSHDNIQLITNDVNNFDCSLVKDYDIIIPLAAIVGAPACDKSPKLADLTNRVFIERLTSSLSDQQLVIFPNSNSAYGKSADICTEESPFNPISLYARSKCEAEQYLLKNHKNSIVLRLATVYGLSDRMRFDLLVNNLTYEAFFTKKLEVFEAHARRNFIHVMDVARCFLHCIENCDAMVGECYNLGNDAANMNKKQLVEMIASMIDCEIGFSDQEDKDKRDYIVSSEKLYKTGFTPHWSVQDGIKQLLPFLKSLPKDRFIRDEIMKTMYNYR